MGYKYKVIVTMIWALLVFLTGCESVNREVAFSDPLLEAEIRRVINKDAGTLYIRDVRSITSLDLGHAGINSISGLQYLTNLNTLSLQGNAGLDVYVLSSMRSLRSLNLRDTGVVDISFLRGLTQLRTLNLRGNLIEDVTVLAHLRKLKDLNFSSNKVVDISALGVLTNLEDLVLSHNAIANISVLGKLRNIVVRLYLQGNPIQTLSPVQGYYHLIEDVDFDIASVTASHPGGWYSHAFYLTLSSTSAKARIFYTLDGSEPTVNALLYSDPLRIDDRSNEGHKYASIKTSHFLWTEPSQVSLVNVVRAMTYVDDEPIGQEIVRTYFVNDEVTRYLGLPIISLVTDPVNLFSDDSGIYVPGDLWAGPTENPWAAANYRGTGVDWERPAHMEFYESDGTRAFAQDIGIRIHGGITRSLPQKSLRIYARSEYGKSAISYPIFGEGTVGEYKRLLLHTSGDDWEYSMFRDGLIQSLFLDTNVDTQAFRPAVVFLNGEFWGMHNIRERYDQYYIASHHDVDPENLDRIELTDFQMRASQGDTLHYEAMLRYLENNDMSLSHNYEYIKTQMDVHSFIDFLIAHIYASNRDSMSNNIQYWRPREPDGRWRWQLHDLDWGFFWQNQNTLSWAAGIIANMPEATLIFRSLLNNVEFRYQFINRYADLLNTRLLPNEITKQIENMAGAIAHVMPEHQERWGRPISMEYWESIVREMIVFAEERPQYVRKHIREFFGISHTVEVEIEFETQGQGRIELNSLLIVENWTGTYFAGVPLVLSSQSHEGFVVDYWVVDGILVDQPTITIIPTKDVIITVLFRKK